MFWKHQTFHQWRPYVFYWSLPFEIKFPLKSELFRVFSEVLMVVFVDTWRRPLSNLHALVGNWNITIRGWLSQKEKQCIDMQHVRHMYIYYIYVYSYFLFSHTDIFNTMTIHIHIYIYTYVDIVSLLLFTEVCRATWKQNYHFLADDDIPGWWMQDERPFD